MKVAIIGTGYVGLTTGVCLGFLGHKVTCLDSDQTKIDTLRSGRAPIYEPGLEELLALAAPNMTFSTSYEEAIPGAEVVFIAVGTPPLPTGGPDLSYLRSASQSVAKYLEGPFTVVVNKSTVPIGSGNWVESLIREEYTQQHGAAATGSFAVASNPEFLREGSALHDSLYPDRVVIGADEPRALEILFTLYRPVLDQAFASPTFLPRPEDLGAVPVISTDLASAELIKYAANAFLATKISYINEIGRLAERVGADITQVAKGIGLDARIGTRFLQPGIGWGGSCFAKDTAALISTASEYGLNMPIVNAAREINRYQRSRVIEKLLTELKILKGNTIAMMGLAFKPHTDDLRDAPSVEIARQLTERGARVRAHDPVALPRACQELANSGIAFCDDPQQIVKGADAVILVTEWPQYRDLPWEMLASSMRNPLVLDGRHFLDRSRLTRAGFRYIGLID
jgi:UDPglucose 6-dehydrogenase